MLKTIVISSLVLLCGCVSKPDPYSRSFDESVHGVGLYHFQKKLPANTLTDAFYFISVTAPSPHGALVSEKTLLKHIAAGTQTKSIRAIYKALMQSNNTFGITGRSHTLNAASLKAALQHYQKGSSSHVQVYFIGLHKYQHELKKLAETKGIQLTYYLVPIPRIKIS